MESIFVVADVFWVAHLGANAVATVGLTESMLTLVYSLAMGLSIGAMALVARRIGEGDPDGRRACRRAGDRSSVSSSRSLIGVFGGWNAPHLLRLMGASDEVVATGSTYTRVMMGGNATIVLLFLINAVFRGAGDAAIAMRVLWIGQRDQHRARALPDLRAWPVSGARRDRRGGRDQHRPRHGRARPAVDADPVEHARARGAPPSRPRPVRRWARCCGCRDRARCRS